MKVKSYFKFFVIACFIHICFSHIVYANSEQLDFNNSLSITSSQLHFSKFKDFDYVSCIGKLKNTSNIAWDEPVIEIQFFNKENELIDTFTEYIYGMVIPANDTIAFRIKDNADKPITNYKSHKVKITSAQPVIKCSSEKKKTNTLYKILISWFPMFLLIGVWIFFMRQYQGKNSPQKKILEIQKNQFELLQKQNELFEKLIETIKNK